MDREAEAAVNEETAKTNSTTEEPTTAPNPDILVESESADAAVAPVAHNGPLDRTMVADSAVVVDASTVAPQGTSTPLLEWFTLERILYTLILLIAGGMRFAALTLEPLQAIEAGNSWAAWLVGAGLPSAHAPAPRSPLLLSLQSMTFWLGGDGDAVARFWPAVAGTVLVWLPWQLRHELGRNVALFLALLLAVNPWLVAFSRFADGTMLALFFGMLALVGLVRLHSAPLLNESARQPWWHVVVVSTGLLLLSGMQAWNFLPVLLLYAWLSGTLPDFLQPERGRSLLLLFLGTVVLGATGWLTRLDGLGYLSVTVGDWIGQLFATPDGGYGLDWLLLRILVDGTFLLVFGRPALATLWRRDSDTPRTEQVWGLFLLIWAIYVLVLLLLPGRVPQTLPLFALPLSIGAAYTLSGMMRRLRTVPWRDGAILLTTLSILALTALFAFITLVHGESFNADPLQIVLLSGGLMVLVVVFFGLWSDWQEAATLTSAFIAASLFLAMLSASWTLTQETSLLHPDALHAGTTHPDVRLLVDNIETLGAQRAGDAEQMAIQVQQRAAPDPVLGWYLRRMRNLTWTPSPAVDEGDTSTLLLEFALDADGSREAQNYLGSDYDLRQRWLPESIIGVEVPPSEADGSFGNRQLARIQNGWSIRTRPLLRWIMYREVRTMPPGETVVLWVPPGE